MKNRTQEATKHRGISRVFVVDQITGKKYDPPRGAQYRVTCNILGSNGRSKRKFKNTNNLQQAIKLRNESGSSEIQRILNKDQSQGMTFHELCEDWKKYSLPSRGLATQLKYQSYLKHFYFFNEMPVETINANTVDQWFVHIKSEPYLYGQHSTRCSYDQEFTVLKQIFSYYQSRRNRQYTLPNIKDHNQMAIVKPKPLKPSKYLTDEQFQQFHYHLRNQIRGTKWEMLEYVALFQYMLGQRIQETAPLCFEDFKTDLGIVVLNKKMVWTRRSDIEDRIEDGHKTNAGKTLPLDAAVIKLLNEYKLKTGLRSGPMFYIDGKPIHYRSIQHYYTCALKKTGLNFGGTHFVRITAVTNAYNETKDVKAASVLAGHKSLITTQGYIKPHLDNLKLALAKGNERLMSMVSADLQLTAN